MRLFWHFAGEHDGTLSVEETRLSEGHCADFCVLPVRHTFMMHNETVAEHIVRFMNTGRFA